jgi:hypothetical protein
MIRMTRLPSGAIAPYFSSVWQLSTVINKNDRGQWFSIGTKNSLIERVRFITKADFESFVAPAHALLKDARRVDMIQLEHNVGGSTPSEDSSF